MDTGKTLRKAFEGIIEVLGPEGKEAIVSELRSRCDYRQEYLETRTIRETLQTLFGSDSADLLLEQVKKVETRFEARIAEIRSGQSHA
jgi:hypothetical protein